MGKLKQALPEDISLLDDVNTIFILEPRWHDRVVLVADHKLRTDNQIAIGHSEFPNALYISGERAKQYPIEVLKTRDGGEMPVRAIPLADLEKEVIDV